MIWAIIGSLGILGFLLGKKAIKISSENRAKIPKNITKWGALVRQASKEFAIPEKYIFSIIWQESSGQPDVNHDSSATGLMGVKPIAVQDVYINLPSVPEGDLQGFPHEPRQMIRAGTAFLKLLYNRYEDIETALKAYKEGGTGMHRNPKRASEYLAGIKSKTKFFG